MKKILGGALVAGTMISQVAAVDVLRTEDAYVNIYGTIRGYFGYGNAMITSPYQIVDDGLMFGIQGNSRIGVRAGVGGFNGNVEIGANEQTVYGVSQNNIGLRQAWASYATEAGTFLAGKTDTLDTMGGFSSDIFYGDGGANGFGGLATSIRRFQIQYKIGGFGISLSENELVNSSVHSGVNWSIPRITVGYKLQSPDLLMNVALAYAFGSAGDTTGNGADVNAVSFVFGIKPKLSDAAWLSFMLSYGMNDSWQGGAGTVPGTLVATGSSGTAGNFITRNSTYKTVGTTAGDVDNFHRVSAFLELGTNISQDVAVLVGGGYQYGKVEGSAYKGLQSYSVYLQMPYKINNFFSVIPQIGWYGLNTGIDAGIGDGDKTRVSAILAAAQIRFSF